jgi:hypothetical protein
MSDSISETLFHWLDQVRDSKEIPIRIAMAMKELGLITPREGGGWELSEQGKADWHKLA